MDLNRSGREGDETTLESICPQSTKSTRLVSDGEQRSLEELTIDSDNLDALFQRTAKNQSTDSAETVDTNFNIGCRHVDLNEQRREETPLDCVLQDEEKREEKEKQQGYRQFIRTKSDDGVEENGKERELDFLFDVREERISPFSEMFSDLSLTTLNEKTFSTPIDSLFLRIRSRISVRRGKPSFRLDQWPIGRSIGSSAMIHRFRISVSGVLSESEEEMFHFRRFARLPLLGVRCRSNKSPIVDEKHVKIERRAAPLNELSPVVRQILAKDPSYAVRFGGQLSDDKQSLVRDHSISTGRAEQLFSQIPKDDLISSADEPNDDFPHPPVVEFPTAENQFQVNLGTEDRTVPPRDNVQCFGCGAKLQCADREKP